DSLGERFPVPARDLLLSGRQVAGSSAQCHSGHRKAAGSSAESTNKRHRLRARPPTIRDNGRAECAIGSTRMSRPRDNKAAECLGPSFATLPNKEASLFVNLLPTRAARYKRDHRRK